MKNRLPIYWIILAAMLVITLCYARWVASTMFFSPTSSAWGNLMLYKWMAAGIGIYALLHRFINKNITWLETFSHELTHIVVALMFMRRVHSFQAGEGSGEVSTSGSGHLSTVPQALAPYCLPIFTYVALLLRCIIADEALWIFDILLGITVAFHFYCFKSQTGSHQPDINQFPLLFSYAYIHTFQAFNLLVLLVSMWPSRSVFSALWLPFPTAWDTLTSLI